MNDTHPTIAAMQIELLRQAGATRRASMAIRLSQDVVERSRRALQEREPSCSLEEIKLRWVELWYGPTIAAAVRQHLSLLARAGA